MAYEISIKDRSKHIIMQQLVQKLCRDTAVAVNPNDDRYKDLIGKEVTPLTNQYLIIADSYVDMQFGTGCIKITPAHDFNDYQMGKRHNLISSIF